MDMRIDQARHHDAVAMIFDRSRREVARNERSWAAPHNRAIVARNDGTLLLMTYLGRCLAECQCLAPDDKRHGATRSSMRKRIMRQTWPSAVANSSSGSLFTRSLKLARIWCLVTPLTARMNGKSNLDL